MLPDDPRHGSPAGYRAGCREDCCRHAIATYNQRRKLLRLRGQAGPQFVSPKGTARRLQALACLGWSWAELSRRMGRESTFLTHIMNSGSMVRPATAKAVAELYESLSMRLPEPTTPNERMSVTRTRQFARSNGWLPPLAWDDIDNDPDHAGHLSNDLHKASEVRPVDHAAVWRVLQGDEVPTTREERIEIMRIWLKRGGSERELCRRMGWKEGRYAPTQNARGAA